MITHFNLNDMIEKRDDQRTFHVASEQHVRIEFRNMKRGETIETFRYGGDVVLTCYRGRFVLREPETEVRLGEMDQAVVPAGSVLSIECDEAGTLQVLWAPAFAPTVKGEQR